jgi:hypothetical protein
LFACLFACLLVCLFVCLFVCILFVCLFVCILFVCFVCLFFGYVSALITYVLFQFACTANLDVIISLKTVPETVILFFMGLVVI